MSRIKRFIRGTGNPITQIANRLFEQQEILFNKSAFTEVKLIPNMCYELDNARYCLLHAVKQKQSLVEIFDNLVPLFLHPCDSSSVGMYKGSKSKTTMKLITNDKLTKFAVCIPISYVSTEPSNDVALISILDNQ